MSDLRTNLLREVSQKLAESFDPKDIELIGDALAISLERYEITERCTDLIVMDNSDEKLIRLYVSSIMSEGTRKTTAMNYYRFLKRFYDHVQKPLLEIATYDIRLYIAKIKQDGVSQNTVYTYYNYISAFYTWLLKEEMIAKNPCAKISKIRSEDTLKYPFTETEIDGMRFNCKTLRQRAELELLLSSGIRVSELCNLNIDDIDFINKKVRVLDGKGGKHRITYMNDITYEYLKKYLNSRKDNNICVFYSRNNCRVSPSTIERDLKKIGKGAGIEICHPHKCRRTFATNLYNRGMSIAMIQELMGHSKIETTMGYISKDEERIGMRYRECC